MGLYPGHGACRFAGIAGFYPLKEEKIYTLYLIE